MKLKLIIILFITSSQVFGQAWVKEKGDFYTKFGINYTNSHSIFDGNSNQVDTLPFRANNGKMPHIQETVIQFYGQYGITDKINGIASIPFKIMKNADDGTTKNGIADMEIGITYALKTENWKITPALYVGIPAGSYDSFSKINYNDSTFDINSTLIFGDGETNFMPRLYFGKGFKKPFYFTGFIGYNYRTAGRSDELDALIEGGYTLKKVTFILKLQLKESFSQGDIFTYTGLYDTGQEYLSPHFSLYYKHNKHLHFSLNVGGAVYARYAQHAASFNFGIAYEK